MTDISFNPYDTEFYRLDENIKQNQNKIFKIDSILSKKEKDKVDLPQILSQLEKDKDLRINHINQKCGEIEKSLIVLNNKLKEEKDKTINTQNGAGAVAAAGGVAAYFLRGYARLAAVVVTAVGGAISVFTDSEEEKLEKKILKLNKEKLELIEEKGNYISNYEKEKNNVLEKIKKNENIDVDILLNEKNNLEQKVNELRGKLEKIRLQKYEIDNDISKLVKELNLLKDQLSNSKQRMQRAEEFDVRLSSASNSYERMQIHTECEDTLGEGKPSKIIQAEKNKIESFNRNIDKLTNRIKKKVLIKTRKIKEIIIDGNNLCYSHSVNIGINALKALIKEIKSRYSLIKVTVIFDKTITKILSRNNEQSIKDEFNTIGVFCEICHGEADPWIISKANESEFNYIISNDKFSDYFDKPAIKGKRIFQHQITGNSISVLDLDIENLQYIK
ncbi:hypothetical protein Q7526_10825 [Glaesserella parasuis]|nr:hypothetical protein [Glaesserella parasuis]MDP0342591.1 hypothetical protein [Glaesserella parasuis]MDP0358364.1 hypothetical protein [Glaesserella parasuis]